MKLARLVVLGVVLFVLFGFGVSDVLAISINQLDEGAVTSANVGNATQWFGYGLEGEFESFSFKHFVEGAFGDYSLAIYECAYIVVGNNCGGATLRSWESITTKPKSTGVEPRVDTWYASDFNQPIVFDPTATYKFILFQVDGHIYGSEDSGSFAGGFFCSGTYYPDTCGENADVLRDMWFVLNVKPTGPELSNLDQLKVFSDEPIAETGEFIGNSVLLRGEVSGGGGSDVQLEVEVKPEDVLFDEAGTVLSDVGEPGVLAVNVDKLIETPEQTPEEGYTNGFHWRARAVDSNGRTSEWQEFGELGNTDFVARYTLGFAAAELAMELKDQPDGYELGARGWDYYLGEFTTSERIINGYDYWNGLAQSLAHGSGIDCSGLVYWAFNRSLDPDLAYGNYVADITADGMSRAMQSSLVSEADLQPGDVMFFDWDDNGRIDHVAMYVGESGGYDVVNALNEVDGIVARTKEQYENLLGFIEGRHMHRNGFEGQIQTGSPVDLIVTDAEGNTLSYDDVIPSDEEFIREVPGKLYYSEIQQGHDGEPKDVIYISELNEGRYHIEVIPSSNAGPEEMYSLKFTANETVYNLAEDLPISEIPNGGYDVIVEENGEVLIPSFEALREELGKLPAEVGSYYLKRLKVAEKQANKGNYIPAGNILKEMKDKLEELTTEDEWLGYGVSDEVASRIFTIMDILIEDMYGNSIVHGHKGMKKEDPERDEHEHEHGDGHSEKEKKWDKEKGHKDD